jgi:N-acyl-D-amino-acid deacylase
VIFDLNAVTDRATYTDPVLPPEGIEWVLIGGETAVQGGQLVREDLGRALRA